MTILTVCNITFFITKGKHQWDTKIIWEGIQPFAAVEKYNSITEKYFDEEAEKLKNFKI